MSKKTTQESILHGLKATSKGGVSTVIKFKKTDTGFRTTTVRNKRQTKASQSKMIELSEALDGKFTAPLEHLNNKADLLAPPENPNRRPTRINADRSLARMKARDRALVGREH